MVSDESWKQMKDNTQTHIAINDPICEDTEKVANVVTL